MCVYDQDLIGYINGLGDLSKMKFTKHFAWEKLLGAEMVF